ncbi:hypothetical protein GUJ93_ZPchr0002g24035 [Zizania palustris]|uniref:CCHC-type domain-containing protein n=1 Tax=Zizania palustris TaxID=103762 RepID=A0A8J5SC26_ZIZPA|nr:hypothetical protein GUJ93_ZPchr0002g24035 [Zizania palustris]
MGRPSTNGMATTLATLGAGVEEDKIVEKIVRSVPPRFKQIVLAITTLLDVSTLTVSDLVGRLKAAEETFEEAPGSLQQDGRLYLTEEEWDARQKKEAENHLGGGLSGGGGRQGGGRRGHGRGRGGRWSGGQSSGKGGDECRRCGKLGHWARECRSKPKREQAHAVEEEEEASLLHVRTSPTVLDTTSTALVGSPTAPLPSASLALQPVEQALNGNEVVEANSGLQIVIREEKVFAQLGEEEEHKPEEWILDTGATNHMSGSMVAFSKLDTAVLGTVWFGDDSVARIEGRGTVTFPCRNGEFRRFIGVYFIPRLTMNIVSVGQLDEDGYKIRIEAGVMSIQEPDGKLLAKVSRA